MSGPGTILFFGSAPTVGDAGIGLAALQALRELFPDAPLRIATGTPRDCEAFELGGNVAVGPKPMLRPAGGWLGTARAWWLGRRLARAGAVALPREAAAAFEGVGLVVFQGGPQGNDVFLPRPKLEELGLRFAAARAVGAPVVLWGQGFGPFAWPGPGGWWRRRLAGRVFASADLIATRDRVSAPALGRLGVSGPRVIEAADAAVRLGVGEADEREADAVLRRVGVDPAGRLLGVCLRDLCGRYGFDAAGQAALVGRVADALDRVIDGADGSDGSQAIDRVVFCSTDYRVGRRVASDLDVMREAVARMRHADRAALVEETPGPAVLAALYGRCRALLAGRLHPAIFAAGRGTPSVMLSYTAKCDDFMARLGRGGAVFPAGAAEAADLAAELGRLATRPAEAEDALRAGMATLRGEATLTMDAVAELVGSVR